MSKPPVCHVNLPQPVAQPIISSVTIPVATPANVVQVVNMLAGAFRAMTNQNPNNAGAAHKTIITLGKDSTPQRPGGGGPGGNGQQGTKSTFKQTAITVTPIKVTNPQDPSQFVIVNQITALTMVNQVTGEQWSFTAPGSVPGSGG